jgi:hypothetical protein
MKDEDDSDVKPDTSTVPKKKKPKVPLKTKEQLMEEARQLEKKLRSDGASVKIDAQVCGTFISTSGLRDRGTRI